ncbi:penicillin-binding protein 1C [Helicobacter didelphidarum]|uniref:peptidoglycan glycosyltransferase n=1 Tax=Helicobacter didelphidarum TaxID=2040648 RepID=A0A3D8IRF1_9HELI|nr:penicillin-binding protein 1C [Helicobacter didelphidarum]RDU67506.1 penicillin-binding protein 1C [Helicobacter didelphidarum]
MQYWYKRIFRILFPCFSLSLKVFIIYLHWILCFIFIIYCGFLFFSFSPFDYGNIDEKQAKQNQKRIEDVRQLIYERKMKEQELKPQESSLMKNTLFTITSDSLESSATPYTHEQIQDLKQNLHSRDSQVDSKINNSFHTRNFIDPFLSRYSKSVFDRNGELLSVFLNKNEQWHINEIGEIPQKLKTCVILYEDKNFYSHFGVDLFAIVRTIKNNITHNTRAGASTLSMQVVKLLESNTRTYSNKFKETIHALRLENLYSKEEILQMYLNNAPYGGNVVGFKSASLLYFSKLPKSLTWAESALLAVLPNAPGLMNISKNRSFLEKKRNTLLHRLYERGIIDSRILSLSLSEPLPKGVQSHVNIAPHISSRVIREDKNQQVIFYTTIDKEIQKSFELAAKEYYYKLQRQDISNLAAILLDTQTSEVLAYLGSQDFLDIENFGQIDGIMAKRSPGSLLKPLLFALSIDEGLIAPESKLIDVPLFFSNFNPKNASYKYYGFVSAYQSLVRSLNIPFVGLLKEYGLTKFFYTLKDILKFNDDNPMRYGLSLILGTKELSMEDIASLYLGLGNMGKFGRIYYTLPYDKIPTKSILTQGASYLTLQTMKDLARAGLENLHKDKKIISWKSGTSYGKKDAWAAGVTPQYTLIVWVGNFTGEENPNLSGVESAGKLFFELFSELNFVDREFNKPNDLKEVEIDTLTGYRITQDLEYFGLAKTTILLPQDSKPLRSSPFLKKVWLDKTKTKEIDSLNSDSSLNSDFIEALPSIKLDLPISVLNYYKLQNVNIYSVNKSQSKKDSTLKIIYPLNDIRIVQTKDFNATQNLIIRIANLKKQKVHWYLDKEYIGSFYDNTYALNLGIGKHHLMIIGEDGKKDEISFYIDK